MNKIVNNTLALGFVAAAAMPMTPASNVIPTYDMQDTMMADNINCDTKKNFITADIEAMSGTYNGVNSNSMVVKSKPVDIYQVATDIFGEMSSMTKDEVKSYNNVLRNISKSTGRNFYEMM